MDGAAPVPCPLRSALTCYFPGRVEGAVTETLVLDRYRVVEKVAPRLGGEAFLAEDADSGAAVVEVHVLPPSAEAEQAFPAVRQAVEQLKLVPPGPLARALDVQWGPEGELVLVQEYQEGRTLADLTAASPLEPGRAREVLRGVLHALAVARRHGLSHGGLSPRRVLVDPAADDRVVLLDLGVMPLAQGGGLADDEAPYRAPGDARGPRADAFAVAIMALELLAGARARPGQPAPEPPPAAAQAVGAEFVKAVQALARADGSARAFDAGALLGLLPARRRRTRRARFSVRESWDGDIGPGTARLLQLGLRPEFRDRMPAEIRGTGTLAIEDDDAPIHFQTDSLRVRPAKTVEPSPAREATPLERTVVEPPPPPPPPPPSTDRPPPVEVRVAPRPMPPADSPFSSGGMVTAPPPPPPPARSTGRSDPFLGLEAALDVPGTADEPTLPVSEPSRLPAPVVLRLRGADAAWFLVAPKDHALDLGRERGNDIILRAFRGSAIENIDSNRISRKHLYVEHRPPEVLIACGQRANPTKASTYGTTIDGLRLPVEKRGAESVGTPTPLPVGRAFQLVLAGTSVRLEGRVAPGSLAVRLERKDGVGHTYVVLWAGTEATLGSGDDDALRLPAAGGVLPGHARLGIDMARGEFQVSPLAGALKVDGRDVPRGAWAPLASGLQVGGATLSARPCGDADFLVVASAIAV